MFRIPILPRPATLITGGLAVVAGSALVTPPPVQAQEVRSVEWTESSRLELPGTLGVLVRALPGVSGDRETRHAIHQQGRLLATTDGNSTTLIDMEERRIVAIDHDDRTYMSISFDESAAAMQEMAEVAREARAGAEEALRESQAELDEAREELRRAMEEAEAEFRVTVRSESTGRTQSVNGLNARQVFLTADIEVSGGVEGVDGTDEGAISFVVELWQSDEFPDLDAIYEEWAREIASDPQFRDLAEELAESMEPLADPANWDALALWHPGVAAGIAQLAEAMQEVEGTTVRSVTHVAFVPQGVTLDRDALLAWQPSSMGDEIRGAAASAAQDAARSAVQGAIGGISRGLFGGGGRDPEPEPEAPPAVRPLLRLTQEKSDIRVGSGADAAAFQIPADYREFTFPGLGGTP